MEFFPGRRLVVLGAGYVGAEVARAGLARGLAVTALTRNPDKAAGLAAGGIGTVVADLASAAWHDRVPADAEFVVNCVSSGGGGPEGYRRSYVDGMRSLLTWAQRANRAGTLVYTSSTSVYPQDGGVRVTEADSTVAAEGTARVLLEAEELARSWPGRAFVLRLAGIYGPGRHYLVDQLRSGAGVVAGRGEHHLNLIHRDDIVEAVFAALTAPATVDGGIFNAADDGAAPKAVIADWLAGRLGLPMPAFSGVPAGGRRAITPDRVIANDRIKSVLGWHPRFPTFREGYEPILKDLATRGT